MLITITIYKAAVKLKMKYNKILLKTLCGWKNVCRIVTLKNIYLRSYLSY